MSTPEQSNEETLESNRRHSTTEGFRRSITRTDARPPSSNSFAMGEHQQGTVRRGLNSLTATPEESQVINNSNPSTLQKAKRDRGGSVKEKDDKSNSMTKYLQEESFTVNLINMETSEIVHMTAKDFARQITLIQSTYFRSIKRKELEHLGWTGAQKKQTAPAIVKMTFFFNQVATWVAQKILDAEKIQNRLQLLSYFIHAGQIALQLENYEGLKCIMSGLQSTPIHRLERTWALLGKKEKTIFSNLEEIVSIDNNSEKYRKHISKSNPPFIPYLGVNLSDLTYIWECVKKDKDNSERKAQYKERLTQFHQMLDDIAKIQNSCYYNFKPDFKIALLLEKQFSEINEEQLGAIGDHQYKLSYSLEPRKTSQKQVEDIVSPDKKYNSLRGYKISVPDSLKHVPESLKHVPEKIMGGIQSSFGNGRTPTQDSPGEATALPETPLHHHHSIKNQKSKAKLSDIFDHPPSMTPNMSASTSGKSLHSNAPPPEITVLSSSPHNFTESPQTPTPKRPILNLLKGKQKIEPLYLSSSSLSDILSSSAIPPPQHQNKSRDDMSLGRDPTIDGESSKATPKPLHVNIKPKHLKTFSAHDAPLQSTNLSSDDDDDEGSHSSIQKHQKHPFTTTSIVPPEIEERVNLSTLELQKIGHAVKGKMLLQGTLYKKEEFDSHGNKATMREWTKCWVVMENNTISITQTEENEQDKPKDKSFFSFFRKESSSKFLDDKKKSTGSLLDLTSNESLGLKQNMHKGSMSNISSSSLVDSEKSRTLPLSLSNAKKKPQLQSKLNPNFTASFVNKPINLDEKPALYESIPTTQSDDSKNQSSDWSLSLSQDLKKMEISSSEKGPDETIVLDHFCTVNAVADHKKKHVFRAMFTAHRSVLFRACNDTELNLWVQGIRIAISKT